jgi:hypothetical protein
MVYQPTPGENLSKSHKSLSQRRKDRKEKNIFAQTVFWLEVTENEISKEIVDTAVRAGRLAEPVSIVWNCYCYIPFGCFLQSCAQ